MYVVNKQTNKQTNKQNNVKYVDRLSEKHKSKQMQQVNEDTGKELILLLGQEAAKQLNNLLRQGGRCVRTIQSFRQKL